MPFPLVSLSASAPSPNRQPAALSHEGSRLGSAQEGWESQQWGPSSPTGEPNHKKPIHGPFLNLSRSLTVQPGQRVTALQ